MRRMTISGHYCPMFCGIVFHAGPPECHPKNLLLIPSGHHASIMPLAGLRRIELHSPSEGGYVNAA
jgi:hypothetical protein